MRTSILGRPRRLFAERRANNDSATYTLVCEEPFHVLEVAEHRGRVRVVVESPAVTEGCRTCGVVAFSHGRRDVRLVEVPCFGRPVELVWRKRT